MDKYKVKILDTEYSSFREDIVKYFVEEVLKDSTSLYDPMAGTAPLIPFCEKLAITSHFNDVNPLHYYLNQAKTLKVYKSLPERNILIRDIGKILSNLKNQNLVISDKWIPDDILKIFISGWNSLNKFENNLAKFYRAQILLCIRPYSSITKTNNATWNKPGGMTSAENLQSVINRNIEKFFNYYDNFYGDIDRSKKSLCNITIEDAQKINKKEKVNTIITSPAYANRYDFTRNFAPEIYFLSKLKNSTDIENLKSLNLATVKVKGYINFKNDFNKIKLISQKAYKFLNEVEKKGREGEYDYYLKYFTHYYTRLFGICYRANSCLSKNGTIYLVVQNNIHRGELIEMDKILVEFFQSNGFDSKVIFTAMRHHQGKRNLSADHPLVLKKQPETIVMAKKC